MKIRWTTDSIRARITPNELASLNNGAPISATFALGDAWSITVAPDPEASSLAANGAAITIRLSPDDLSTLSSPDTEGVYLSTTAPNPIRYFVEKDFPCAHPRAIEATEPISQTFDPPLGFSERKLASS